MSKPSRGRPPKSADAMMEPVTIRLPKLLREAIDDYREDRMDEPDFATAVRELLVKGLEASKGKRSR